MFFFFFFKCFCVILCFVVICGIKGRGIGRSAERNKKKKKKIGGWGGGLTEGLGEK